MFIFKDTQKRANIHAPYTAPDGTKYPKIPRELLNEIPEPAAPVDYSPETYYRTGQDTAPYVIYTKKSDEQLAELMLQKAKAERADAVANIVVTTQAGNSFDGHEDAQNRMSRAVAILTDDALIPWVLADNTVKAVSKVELTEALMLAGTAQAEIWVKPYVG